MWESILAAAAPSVISGLMGSDASSNAADAQVRAGQESNATQMAMFNQNRADLAPWRTAGSNALDYMAPGLAPGGEFNRNFTMADYEADPGYGFRQDEALRQWQNNWSARGGGAGGPTDPNTGATKDLLRWSQGLASQEYGNAFNRYMAQTTNRYNRLAGVAGTGQTAANQIAGMGTNVAGQVGQTMQGMGNARASGYMGGANAWSNALGQGYNQYQGNQMMDIYRQALGLNKTGQSSLDASNPYVDPYQAIYT